MMRSYADVHDEQSKPDHDDDVERIIPSLIVLWNTLIPYIFHTGCTNSIDYIGISAKGDANKCGCKRVCCPLKMDRRSRNWICFDELEGLK